MGPYLGTRPNSPSREGCAPVLLLLLAVSTTRSPEPNLPSLMAPLLYQGVPKTFAPPIPRARHRLAPRPPSAAAFLRGLFPARPPPAKAELLRLIADQGRGLETQSDPARLADIVSCIDALAAVSPGADTVSDAAKLSGTWRLLWTTEQEQLFIVRNAPFFRTAAGDVLQVIDVPGGALNNVITFPPSGAFVVNGVIEVQPPQRVNFRQVFFYACSLPHSICPLSDHLVVVGSLMSVLHFTV